MNRVGAEHPGPSSPGPDPVKRCGREIRPRRAALRVVSVRESRFHSRVSESILPGIELVHLPDGGLIPNHPRFPVIVYRGAARAVPGGDDRAGWFERTFARHGWTDAWRNGIYPFHHYHSHTHEVLGCHSGSANVLLGGADGVAIVLASGDAVLLPAGTGHCNLGASDDFGVVGAYPAGCECDMRYGRAGERPAADEAIVAVPMPACDPIHGAAGPALLAWGSSVDAGGHRSPTGTMRGWEGR